MSHRLTALACALVFSAPTHLHGQCPDGTPPPCDVVMADAVQTVQPPPAEQRGRSFLVLPFRNVTRAPDHDWLVEGATTLLSDALGHWEEVSVIPAERLYPALRRHQLQPGDVMEEPSVRRVAEETGGWTAVTGEVLVTGNRVRVSARAYDVVSSELVVQASEDAQGEEDILPAFERLAGRLLITAGLEEDAAAGPAAATQSLDAYRAYLRGLGHYHRNEMHQARAAFQQAVQLDSAFAQAHLKLAESLLTTREAFQDPQSPAYRHAERAAALSRRLSPRDRELVQSIAALFQGQVGAAREGLERTLADDPNDLEALENLSDIERFDPVLVATPDGERPRGSLTEAARLAKRALALDPGRHQNYETLTAVYLLAAGELEGRVVGIRGEQASLMDLFQSIAQRPARSYVAVLRDTIELVPADSLNEMDPDSLRIARARAATAAAAWAGRWVAATPDAALANLMASQAYAHAGQHALALRHLEVADSLGIEVEILQNLPGRRVQLLTRAGEYEMGAALADSLMEQGYLTTAPDPAALVFRQQDLGWFFNLYLLGGRVAKADSLVSYLVDFAVKAGNPYGEAALTQGLLNMYALRTDARTPVGHPAIPEDLRYSAQDSLVAHLDDLPAGGVLDRNLGLLLSLFLHNAPERVALERVRRLRSEAERRLAAGEGHLSYSLVFPSVNIDTTSTGREETYDLLRAITERHPEEWDAHYELGKLGAVSGMYLEEAEAALRRYLEHEPIGAEPDKTGALWRLGMVLEHKGDVEGARASYEEALRLNPEHAESRAALARMGPGGG